MTGPQSSYTVQVTEPTDPMPPFDYARISLTAVNARFSTSEGAYDASFVPTIPNPDCVRGYRGQWTGDDRLTTSRIFSE